MYVQARFQPGFTIYIVFNSGSPSDPLASGYLTLLSKLCLGSYTLIIPEKRLHNNNGVQDLYKISGSYIISSEMHPLQEKILEVAKLNDLRKYTYRELAGIIGCQHASQAKHHLEQLKKRELLQISQDGSITAAAKVAAPGPRLPILGEADCGEATKYASDRIEGYLRLSPSLLPKAPLKRLYVLRARGNSMNMANVDGDTIDDGDYVIVEKRDLYVPEDGEIVVSVIDGMANIKRFRKDEVNQRVVLTSQSTNEYPPIVISNEDLEQYLPIGKVVSVIKGLAESN